MYKHHQVIEHYTSRYHFQNKLKYILLRQLYHALWHYKPSVFSRVHLPFVSRMSREIVRAITAKSEAIFKIYCVHFDPLFHQNDAQLIAPIRPTATSRLNIVYSKSCNLPKSASPSSTFDSAALLIKFVAANPFFSDLHQVTCSFISYI